MKLTPPSNPAGHDLHRSDQRRMLPVPLSSVTIAVGHQALHRQARQLPQPMQIFKRVGEAGKTTFLQERPQTQFNACRLFQRLPPLATRGAVRSAILYC